MNDELPPEPARRPERVRGHAAARSLLVVAAALSVVAALLSPAPAAQASAAAPAPDAAPTSLRTAPSITPAPSTTTASDSLSPAPAAHAAAARWPAASAVFAAAPGAVALAQPGGFGDVAGDAYYSEPVATLAAMGVFAGTECDGGFCPHEPIDRKTMAVWTVRVVTGQDPPAVSLARFDDVDAGSLYAPFVERMAQLRITLGCGDGIGFCPDDAVTRAQMAVFLSRAFSLPDGPDPGFADVAADAWYATEVAALAESGITRGCGDGTVFCPGQDTTRAQMATFLWRAEQRGDDTPAVEVPTDGVAVIVPRGGSFVAEFDAVTVEAATGALSGEARVSLSETSVGTADVPEGEQLAVAPIAVEVTDAEIVRPLTFRFSMDTSSLTPTGVVPAWYSDELDSWVPLDAQSVVIGDGEVTFTANLADAEAVSAATAFGSVLLASPDGLGAGAAAFAFPVVPIIIGIIVFVGVAATVTVVALNSETVHLSTSGIKEFFQEAGGRPARFVSGIGCRNRVSAGQRRRRGRWLRR